MTESEGFPPFPWVLTSSKPPSSLRKAPRRGAERKHAASVRNEDHVWGRRHQSAAAWAGGRVGEGARTARGLGRQQPVPLLGVGGAEPQQEASKRLDWPSGRRQGGGAGAATLWGWEARTQPRLPGTQLRPRAQEQIVLGGGGGSGCGGSGPPRSQAENQQREAAASGGGAPPSVRWLPWNNKK